MSKLSTNRASPKKNYHHGNLAEMLFATAMSVLQDEGPQAGTIRRIAKNIGVSAPAVYHHFKNREDLLMQLAVCGYKSFIVIAKDTIKDIQDADEQMKQYAMSLFKFSHENKHLYSLMFETKELEEGFFVQKYYDVVVDHYTIMREISKCRIEKNGYSVDAESLSLATWCAVDGLCRVLNDKRAAKILFNLTGSSNIKSLKVKEQVASIVSDIFVGRLS